MCFVTNIVSRISDQNLWYIYVCACESMQATEVTKELIQAPIKENS